MSESKSVEQAQEALAREAFIAASNIMWPATFVGRDEHFRRWWKTVGADRAAAFRRATQKP